VVVNRGSRTDKVMITENKCRIMDFILLRLKTHQEKFSVWSFKSAAAFMGGDNFAAPRFCRCTPGGKIACVFWDCLLCVHLMSRCQTLLAVMMGSTCSLWEATTWLSTCGESILRMSRFVLHGFLCNLNISLVAEVLMISVYNW